MQVFQLMRKGAGGKSEVYFFVGGGGSYFLNPPSQTVGGLDLVGI